MKFQVHGELDIPKEVTELLIGMTFGGIAPPFQDIEMRLSQTALDRLSIILHLVYATQPIEDVKAYLESVCMKQNQPAQYPPAQYQQPHSVQVPYPTQTVEHTAIPMPTQRPATMPSARSNAVSLNQSDYRVPEAKLNTEVTTQSIAALGNRMKGRVG